MADFYTLKRTDVGHKTIKAFGRRWPVEDFLGRVLVGDVGKRVFERGGILQVESDRQRDFRLARGNPSRRNAGGTSTASRTATRTATEATTTGNKTSTSTGGASTSGGNVSISVKHNPATRVGGKGLTLRNMAVVTVKRLPGGAVAITGRKMAGGRANPGSRKSAFSLWGPKSINGYRKWGVNEKRKYGVYTVGPHDGYHTRAEASELLREKRAGERLPPYDPRA